jgi:uncharacterized membrane protein YbhN (UPF0104 family)
MKRAIRLFGGAVAIAATALSIYLVARSWQGEDLSSYATPSALGGIALATAFYIAGVAVSALAWRQLLLGMGLRNRWMELCGIVSATQIGKYLPGNVAHHIGRGALSLERGIGPLPLVTTGLAEIALLCLASVSVGGAALALSGRIGILGDIGEPRLIAAVLSGAALVLAGIAVLHRLTPWLLARLAPQHAAPSTLSQAPGALSLLRAFALYALVYLVFGAGILAMAGLLLPGVATHGWLLLAAFSLAWIIGFATPGAPAGVGVREAVMLLLLSEAYDPADASALILAIRVATTLGDVALLPLGWWQLRATRPAPGRPETHVELRPR